MPKINMLLTSHDVLTAGIQGRYIYTRHCAYMHIGLCPDCFLIFGKLFFGGIFYEYFSFSLTWDRMGAKISKRYSYKSQPKVLKVYLNFLPNGPHKTTLGIFEI